MNFVFKLDPDQKIDPKMHFKLFFQILILPVLLSELAVCRANRIAQPQAK